MREGDHDRTYTSAARGPSRLRYVTSVGMRACEAGLLLWLAACTRAGVLPTPDTGGASADTGGAKSGRDDGVRTDAGADPTDCLAERYLDDPSATSVEFVVHNDSDRPMVIDAGSCAWTGSLEPRAGGERLAWGLPIGHAGCEAVAASELCHSGVIVDCSPPTSIVEPGGSYSFVWTGNLHRMEVMATDCTPERCGETECVVSRAAPAGPYRVRLDVSDGCASGIREVECSCIDDGQGHCTTDLEPDRARSVEVVLDFDFPQEDYVEVRVDCLGDGCGDSEREEPRERSSAGGESCPRGI